MFGLGVGSQFQLGGFYSPRSLTPIAWYDASQGVVSSSNLVSQWNDISGNNHHLVQATGSKQPVITSNLVNGRPAIVFDGVDDFMQVSFTLNQPTTMFMVAKVPTLPSAGVHDILCDGGVIAGLAVQIDNTPETKFNASGNSTAITAASAIFNNIYDVATFVANTTSSIIRSHKVQVASGNTGSANPGGLTLGALENTTRSLAVNIAEVIIYPAALSASQMLDIENELIRKYGL